VRVYTVKQPFDVALKDVSNFLSCTPNGQQPGAYGTGTTASKASYIFQNCAVFQSLFRHTTQPAFVHPPKKLWHVWITRYC